MAALIWLLQAGPVRPQLAYTAPFAVLFQLLLAIAFGLGFVGNLAYEEFHWGVTLLFLVGAVGMGYCAAEGFYFRLRWDDNGFQVRRLVGKSFSATWAQVRGAGVLNDLEYRVVLSHPSVSAVGISRFLVGAKEFIRALRRHTGREN
ncbi:MAG: hypothetical protein JNL81_12570 [Hyphomonadaceae bacterium]|nr:hypothetical protein [Hyphomonadaceae bacterium]